MDLTKPSDSLLSCFCNQHDSPSGSNNNDVDGYNASLERNQQQPYSVILGQFLGKKLAEMSPKERSNAIDDIHGISEMEESPQMIQKRIQEMNEALAQIVTSEESKAYRSNRQNHGDIALSSSLTYYFRLAMTKSPDYVEKLKIAFLRTDEYDSSKAATRLIRFFQRKVELFGEDSLVRDLEFDTDLEEDGQDAMNRGLAQILPERDRAGRAIVFCDMRSNSSKYSTDTLMRCMMYICMCAALQDVETQQRGIVLITYALGPQDPVPGRPAAVIRTWNSLPLRLSAYHPCVDTPKMVFHTYIFCSYMENRNICRCRVHTGTLMECIYELMTFGIPKDVIPINVADGSIDLTSHHVMLETLKRIELAKRQKESQYHVPPNEDDVIEISRPQHNQEEGHSNQEPAFSVATSNNAAILNEVDLGSIMNMNEFSWDTMSVGVEDENPVVHQHPSFSEKHTPQFVLQDIGTITHKDMPPLKTDEAKEKEFILVPNPMDIILGKGRRSKNRPGSLRLHNLLLQYQDQYDDSTKSAKNDLTITILQIMKKSGCRFLTVLSDVHNNNRQMKNPKRNKCKIYVECDVETARESIAHGFRNLRMRKAKQQQEEANSDNVCGGSGSKKGLDRAQIVNESSSVLCEGIQPKKGTDLYQNNEAIEHGSAKKRLRISTR